MLNAEFRVQNAESLTRVRTSRSVWRRCFVLPAFCILHSALLVSLTACGTKARAQTLPDGPPLAVPVAPAHEISIEQIAEAPPPEPEPAPEPVVSTPKPTVTKVQTGKPQPQPAATAPANQPAVAPTPAPEAPVRASPTPSAGDDKKARELIAKATYDLDKRVDYQKLSAEGKQQYDQSKRFRDQAVQAIQDRNLVLAVTLAEKAATLAAELVR